MASRPRSNSWSVSRSGLWAQPESRTIRVYNIGEVMDPIPEIGRLFAERTSDSDQAEKRRDSVNGETAISSIQKIPLNLSLTGFETSECYSMISDDEIVVLQRAQGIISNMTQILEELESTIFHIDADSRFLASDDSVINKFQHRCAQFELEFVEFAKKNKILILSGLSQLASIERTTVSTLLKEIHRLLYCLREKSLRLYEHGFPKGRNVLPEPVSGMQIPRFTGDRPVCNQGRLPSYYSLHDINSIEFLAKTRSIMDTIHFGLLSDSVDGAAPIRFSAVSTGGAIQRDELSFSMIAGFVSKHLHLSKDMKYEIWCMGRLLNEQNYKQYLFSYVQNKIVVVLDPTIILQIDHEEDGKPSGARQISTKGLFLNKSRITAYTIKDLIRKMDPKEHPDIFPIDELGNKIQPKDIFVYFGAKQILDDFLPIGESGDVPIQTREGFASLKLIVSFNARKRTCPTCLDLKIEERFPTQPITSSCYHTDLACLDCLDSWIQTKMSPFHVERINCPQCDNLLTMPDVLRVVAEGDSKARYLRFLELKRISTHASFYWCCAPHCNSGQIYKGPTSDPMTCENCKLEQCVKHSCPWSHGGENISCDEFEQELQGRINIADNTASLATIATISKACPSCQVPTEKNEGCDHMTCTRCESQWCWQCRADWIDASGRQWIHTQPCTYWQPNPDGGDGTEARVDANGIIFPAVQPPGPGGINPMHIVTLRRDSDDNLGPRVRRLFGRARFWRW